MKLRLREPAAAALMGALLGFVTPAFVTTARAAAASAPYLDAPSPGFGPIVGGVDLSAPTPTITSISPTTGASTGGTVVTIHGTNFSTTAGATTAAFGLAPATGVSCASSTTCTVSSPSGHGTVDVTIAVGGKANSTSPADQFTYAVMPATPATPATPAAPSTVGLAGVDRIQTAIAVSQEAFPIAGSAKAVVLARDDLYPDALTGGPLAAAKGGPLLLTGPSSLDPASRTEITRLLPVGGTVYVLGGGQAVSSSVAQSLLASGFRVDRLSGPNRFATAVAVANVIGPSVIYEANGLDFADALSAGPAAVQGGGAILLTDGPYQAPETAAYISAHVFDPAYAVGGAAAAADPSAIPLVGSDRFATAVAVADRFFSSPSAVGIATGLAFPDALSAGPLLGTLGSPMILVPPTAPLPPSVVTYLKAHSATITRLDVFGGTAAVSRGILTAATAVG